MSESVDLSYPLGKPWTLGSLLYLDYDKCREAFSSMPAPAIDELNGEYRGYNLVYRYVGGFDLGAEFLGKGFRRNKVRADLEGEGYIIWRVNGEVRRNNQFGWYYGKSRIDGQRSLIMNWQCVDDPSTQEYGVDEVRVAAPGLYFCSTVNDLPRPEEPNAGVIHYWVLADKAYGYIGPDHVYPFKPQSKLLT